MKEFSLDSFRKIGKYRSVLGESPVWDEKLQRLYWVDIESKKLYAWDYNTNNSQSWNFDNKICAISLTEDKEILLCAFDKFFAFYNINSNKLTKLNNDLIIPNTVRFNDGKTDGFGRFWCGTMSESYPKKPEASIYMLDNNLKIYKIFEDIIISNSIVSSNDNKSIYFSDTPLKRIYKANFSNEGVNNTEKANIFVGEESFIGFPDGSTIDVENNLWNAEWDGSRVVVYNNKAEIINEINLSIKRPTSCTFGGPAMDLLFITSAMLDNNLNNEKKNLNGRTLCIKTNSKGNFSKKFKCSDIKAKY